MRLPPDVSRVLDVFLQLGHGARRGLWLAERHAEAELREAARRASLLARRLHR